MIANLPLVAAEIYVCVPPPPSSLQEKNVILIILFVSTVGCDKTRKQSPLRFFKKEAISITFGNKQSRKTDTSTGF